MRCSRKIQQLTGGPVIAANKEPLTIMYQTRSRISVAGEDFTLEILVVDGVSQDCLLSADFLSTHGFTVDLKSDMLSSGTISTPFTQPHTTVPSVCCITIRSSVVIRCGEKKMFRAEVKCPLFLSLANVLHPKLWAWRSNTSCFWQEWLEPPGTEWFQCMHLTLWHLL